MIAPAPLVAFTALDILALATLIGALACRLWLLPAADEVLQEAQASKLSRLTLVCLVLLSVTSLALFAMRAHGMSGEPYLAMAPILPEVLLDTHYGTVWIVRVAAVSVVWLLVCLPRHTLTGAGRSVWMLAAAAVLAFTRSASSHAADAGDFSAHEMVDWVHLMVISLWAGSVIAAAWTVFPSSFKSHARSPLCLAHQGVRISQLATAALGMVLASGVYNAWRTLGGWDALWGTLYGHRLLIKLALVLAMLGFGAANRYLNLPYLADAANARRFTHVLYGEAAVAVAVIMAAAVMINTAPPRPS